jgi:hypothetical protein
MNCRGYPGLAVYVKLLTILHVAIAISLSATRVWSEGTLIGEESGPPPAPSCDGVICATVEAIRRVMGWEPAPPANEPGVYLGAENVQTPEQPANRCPEHRSKVLRSVGYRGAHQGRVSAHVPAGLPAAVQYR